MHMRKWLAGVGATLSIAAVAAAVASCDNAEPSPPPEEKVGVAVVVAIMAATVAAVWFTSGSGLTTSSALNTMPNADRHDGLEAQSGALAGRPAGRFSHTHSINRGQFRAPSGGRPGRPGRAGGGTDPR